MRLKVHVEKISFDVPCADGSQSVKWLGCVAAQRWNMMSPHGRLRARETEVGESNVCVPSNVIGPTQESVDPSAIISQVFKDGASVKVEIQNRATLDEINSAVQTEWQIKAFSSDSLTTKIRHKGIETRQYIKLAEQKIQSNIKRRQREAERYKLAKALASKSHLAPNVVLVGLFDTEEDEAVALELDWPVIEQALCDLGCAPSPTCRDAMRCELRSAYRDFNRIYVRYAGVGRVGEANGLTALDFAHFVHIARIACLAIKGSEEHQERNYIMRAYTQACRRRIDAAMTARRLAMEQNEKQDYQDFSDDCERMSTLLSRAECDDDENYLQEAKYTGGYHTKQPTSFQSSPRERPDNNDTHKTLMDALENLIRQHVTPFLATRRAEDPFILAFDSSQVQATLQNARPHLQRVFKKYAGTSKKLQEEKDMANATREVDLGNSFGCGVTLDGIKKVIKDCGLTALFFIDEYAAERLDKNALDAFLAVQNDPPVHNELEELTFIEFIESYARVAATMLECADLQRKITLAIDRLCTFSLSL